jgi:hypothetical protein
MKQKTFLETIRFPYIISSPRVPLRTLLIAVLLAAGAAGGATPVAADSHSSEAGGEAGYRQSLDFAQVRRVEMEANADGSWNFSVTVRHADTGWDHYANLWQVLDHETGEVLGERPLAHPHTSEQPFTRSLRNVSIPDSVEIVRVRARCNTHGFEGTQVQIPLDTREGENYVIRRN